MSGPLPQGAPFTRRSLFRPEVSEKNSDTWLGEIRLAEPVSHRIWALGSVTLMIILILWLVLGEYTRRERVQGMLVPSDGYARIKARGPGEVQRIFVREGDKVTEGQVLIEVDSDRYSVNESGVAQDVSATIIQEQATLRDDIVSIRAAAEERYQNLGDQIALVQAQMKHNSEMLAIYREEARAHSALLSKVEPAVVEGHVSGVQVLQLRSSAAAANATVARQLTEKNSLEQKLRELQGQFEQAKHETSMKFNESRRALARAEAAFDKNEGDRRMLVRAPLDGVVSSLLVYPGQTISQGSSLATLVSENAQLEADLLIGSSAVGFVRPGNEVRIQFMAYPFQKFGVHKGRIEYISRSALSPAEVSELTGRTDTIEPLYRARASLDKQTILVYGENKRLTAGMAISAGIMLDRRRIYEWIFEPLYTLRKNSETAP
jgi:membrane fusion protein